MREKRVLEGEGFLVSVRRVMQKSIVLWLHNTNRMTDFKMSQMTGQLTSDDIITAKLDDSIGRRASKAIVQPLAPTIISLNSGNGAEASACHSQSRRR